MSIRTASTIPERWEALCWENADFPAIIHWVAGAEPVRWTRRALWQRAQEFAVLLRENGVARGDVCAVILRHHPDFYPLYMGVALMGAIPAVLAYPNARIHPEKYRTGLHGMAQRSGLQWILTTRDLQETMEPLIPASGGGIRGILYPLEGSISAAAVLERVPVSQSDPFLLQHSSGTTGLQKGVVLSHHAILAHAENYAEAISLSPHDRVVSWLPLYHDMGLIAAFHIPLLFGIPTIQIDPFEWVLAPQLLCEAVTSEQATLCWLPNFAYNLLADRVRDEEVRDYDFRSVRMLINCSEPIRAESHAKFLRRFAPAGLRESALSGCYAMAETTFAVTQTVPDAKARVIAVDRESLARGRVVVAGQGRAARESVSSGVAIRGCDLRIVDESGRPVEGHTVGEIIVKSVSLFDGYRNYPEKTAEVLRDGWYWTGDIGFTHEGELFVIGRRKDVIIVAGKNIYPEDIEDAVSAVPGVIPGRVVAFGDYSDTFGTEEIWVVAESAVPEGEHDRLISAIREAGAAMDVTISHVAIKPPRWLIKSSAGKPSRNANRQRAIEAL